MAKKSFAESFKKLFGMHTKIDDVFFEDLTDSLIEGDVGARVAFEIGEALQNECKKKKIDKNEDVLTILRDILLHYVKSYSLEPDATKCSVYLVLGVNGVGKTTTIAKLGGYYKKKSLIPLVFAAADTFRAAAIEQLQQHGERVGVRVVAHKHGSDPGAVVFDAGEAIIAQGSGLVIADTAGRLHNKENLVRELQKIDKIAQSKADEACYKKILVLDATTGQNGLRQAEVFHEAIGLDALILTKYDSTAKGGIAITAGKELNLPVAFVCFGEGYSDIAPFDAKKYIDEFIGRV